MKPTDTLDRLYETVVFERLGVELSERWEIADAELDERIDIELNRVRELLDVYGVDAFAPTDGPPRRPTEPARPSVMPSRRGGL